MGADLDAQEQELHRLIADGDVGGAVTFYWRDIGNFSKLDPLGEHLRGRRLCQSLVDVMTSENTPADARTAIVNDLGQFAMWLGDLKIAAQAANDAESWSHGLHPLMRATLARHRSDALLAGGRVIEALQAAWMAQRRFMEAMRLQEGVPTREAMDECDLAHVAEVECQLRKAGAEGVRRTLERLARWHANARRLLANLNRPNLMPIGGPSGEVDADALANGYPAAQLALLEGRHADALRITEGWRGLEAPNGAYAVARTELSCRILLACGKTREAATLAEAFSASAPVSENPMFAGRAAVLNAACLTDRGMFADAGAAAKAALPAALGREHWLNALDLLLAQAVSALALGRDDEARQAAWAALIGETDAFPALKFGSLELGCDAIARQAITVLQAAGAQVDEAFVAAANVGLHDEAPPPPPQNRRRMAAVRQGAGDRRKQLHEQALQVIRDYETEGVPFVLLFRKYDIDIMHGPMEYGPRLTEAVLFDALPESVNLIAIQAQGRDVSYSGSETALERIAPSLLLGDDEWQDVARWLIANADLIVSEATMMGEGVAFELQTIFRLNRWDRTVLALPPPDSPFRLIDNLPVVQKFPRCIWAHDFHTTPIDQHVLITDLLDRMRAIGQLPASERRRLKAPADRDTAFPIDLRRIAEAHELEAAKTQFTLRNHTRDAQRHCLFWTWFRAAGVRGWLLRSDVPDDENRVALADAYGNMSDVMCSTDKEDGRYVIVGDLLFAEQCAESALTLLATTVTPRASHLVLEAERRLAYVQQLRAAVADQAERFELRPQFGPFPVRRSEQDGSA